MSTTPDLLSTDLTAGFFVRGDVAGVAGQTAAYDRLVNAVNAFVTSVGREPEMPVISFPPVIDRAVIERSEFFTSFPNLLATVHVFDGTESDHLDAVALAERHGDWGRHQQMTDLVLSPAVCYHVYPLLSGQTLTTTRRYDVSGQCFRREPSPDPARMQSFRMREFVCVGPAVEVQAWRDRWMELAVAIGDGLGLDARLDVANDPFFGAGARFLGATQREAQLKFELRAVIAESEPTAVLSVNLHKDHFGKRFAIAAPDGSDAQTSCIGVGIDRLALAVLSRHGGDEAGWPESITRHLS